MDIFLFEESLCDTSMESNKICFLARRTIGWWIYHIFSSGEFLQGVSGVSVFCKATC